MDEVTKYLIAQGTLGIVILGLCFAVKTLWTRYCDSQDLRIKDGLESVKAIQANTHVLEGITEILRDRRAAQPSKD